MPPSKRKPKDDEQSVTSESKQPIKNVPALMGEGEKFFRDQLFGKAIQCYTEALELSPGNINALVERSACYLKTGKNDLALADAEESLKENKDFTKGLYQKAEALYAMGEFELALVFYHRGKKLRGDVREFQLGINKAQEAIDNCVGDPEAVKLEVKGDLSYFDKPDEDQKKQKKQQKIGYQKPLAQKQLVVQKREKRPVKQSNQKTIKQLLGELYADKIYLENLLQDDHATRANTKAGDAIWGLANNGLDFLDSRTEFWRQQKPIYARKASKQAVENSNSKNPLNYILKQLEVIDNLQSAGKHAESLDKSNKLMIYVNKLSDSQVPDKKAIISNIYSNIGNANLEMGKYEQALQAHQKDLEISKETDNKEGISRAYENIGRVYARNGKYKEAIDVWEKKLPFADSNMEKAWLYHEIGRCHLELGDYQKAKDYGKQSLEYSEKIEDEVWQLNATVLIAQSEAKIGTIESLNNAIENFEKASKMTEKQNDEPASKAIRKALADCREKLKKLQVDTKDEEEKQTNEEEKQTSEEEDQEKEKNEKKTPTPEPKRESPSKESIDSNKKSVTPTNKSETPSVKDTPRATNDTPSKNSQASKESPTPSKVPIDYKVHVKTANDMSAGTDAEAFISLYGASGELIDLPLKNNEGLNQFETGKIDYFDFNQLKDIGKLKKIKLTINAKDDSSSWKIEYVKVICNKNLYHFDVNQWLDADFKKENDPFVSLEVELKSFIEGVTVYEVFTKTADESSAGTDGTVTLDIFGSNGELIDVPLNTATNSRNPFERDSLDNFELDLKNIGKIKKICVECHGSGLGNSWKIEFIRIHVEKMVYTFTANRWIENGKVELTPDSEPVPESERAEYTVVTYTGKKIGAGTDSNIFINIIGDKGETGKIHLKKNVSKTNPFEKGKSDTFKFDSKNVGEIKKINISHDGESLGAGWYLDKVEVKNMANNSFKNFPVDRWLDVEEGDGRVSLDLVPDVKPENKPKK